MTMLRKLLILPVMLALDCAEVLLAVVVVIAEIAADLADRADDRISRVGRRLLDWARDSQK